MKKKVLALLCAAALAFGVPATAFGLDLKVEDGKATSGEGTITLQGGVIKNLVFEGADAAKVVVGEASVSTLPTNALQGSGSACTIAFCDEEGKTQNSAGRDCVATFIYQVNDAVTGTLPSGMSVDNLYIGGKFDSELQGASILIDAQKVALVQPDSDATTTPNAAVWAARVSLKHLDTGTLTLWVLNGKYGASDALIEAKPISDNDSDDSFDDSPRYIDGMPELDVAGTSGVVAWGNLAGANIPAGAAVSIAANAVTSGAAYNDLRAAMGSGRLLGAFQVDLTVNGAQIHNGFGELGLAFPMPYGFEGRTVTVWHRHNDGSITSQVATVENGEVRITTRDLSEFAIELGAPVSDDASVSPKTGQTIPAGTAAFALGTVIALGAVSVVVARRKMTR